MTVRFERLPAGRTDYELIWTLVAIGSALAALAAVLLGLRLPACTFQGLTGLPCLTCGGTRCLRAILDGDISAAIAWNPLVAITLTAAAAFTLYGLTVVLFRLPRLRIRDVSPSTAWAIRGAIVVVAAANWIYLLWRLAA